MLSAMPTVGLGGAITKMLCAGRSRVENVPVLDGLFVSHGSIAHKHFQEALLDLVTRRTLASQPFMGLEIKGF